MSIAITTKSLLSVRRDKQINSSAVGSGSTSAGGAGGSGATSVHNGLTGLQGGTTDEYYHLTSAEYTGSGTGVFARVASPTFTGDVTMPGTGVWKSTGKVGIRTANPTHLLHIQGAPTVLAGTSNQITIYDDDTVFSSSPKSGIAFGGTYNTAKDVGYYAAIQVEKANTTENNLEGIMSFWTRQSATGNLVEGFRLDEDGNVGINTTSPGCALCVNGGVHIGGDSDAGNDNLWIDGIAQEPNFTAGWTAAGGSNWQINTAGDAVFNDLMCRGSAHFRELIIDQLSVIGGSTLQSVARGKIASIDTANSKITLDDPYDNGACQFANNDFFWSKNIDIDGAAFSDLRGQITDVTGLVLTLDFGVAGANGAIADFSEGDVVVQRGHPTTAGRQNLIYITVSDTGAPFRRILTGIDSLAAFSVLGNIVLQDGNLDTLDGHDIVPASPGYGLYSDNVYLSGTIHSVSGNIGGWNISANALYYDGDSSNDSCGMAPGDYPFYAGEDYDGRATANFRVTQDGSLTATGIAELGTATADYAGNDFNLALKGADIYENSFNNDGGNLYFNRIGYDGGTTKFRTTTIGNGKNQLMADFVGTDDEIIFYSKCKFDSGTSVEFDGPIDAITSATIDLGGAHVVDTSTSDDTCAVAASDISGFSQSVTPKGDKIFVSFSIPVHPTTGNQTFNIIIDVGGVTNYDISYFAASTVLVATGSTIIDVTPNSAVTVKLRWSGTTAVQYLGSTNTYGLGRMNIIDLY